MKIKIPKVITLIEWAIVGNIIMILLVIGIGSCSGN